MRTHISLAVASCLLLAARPSAQVDPWIPAARAILESHVPPLDDPDALAERLVTTATKHAATLAAHPLITEARRTTGLLQNPAACLRRVEEFLAGTPHPLAADEARQFRAELLDRSGRRDEALREYVQRYASLLEERVRRAPENWFNFYDFWRAA